ncbi:DUF397 domain-containing protein [Actinomadura welshii]
MGRDRGVECRKVGESSGIAGRKSSYSGSTGGDCVGVARLGARQMVRDSKNPEGGVLWL